MGFVLSRMTSHPNPRELYKKLQAAFLLHLTETWIGGLFVDDWLIFANGKSIDMGKRLKGINLGNL
jgi:hypothetical protein